MLVLFETPAGYAIFKVLDEKKIIETKNLYEDFETPEAASRLVRLHYFYKFEDTTEALAATTSIVDGKLSKSLKRTLRNSAIEAHEQLAVADAKLGCAIKDKLSLSCITNTSVHELIRCIRSQADSLITAVSKKEMSAMALGLAHSLSRYKLKFSPDKIDTMVIQAVCLLDELDKEINNYIMRAREWYGWHFPEMGKIVTDNMQYIKTMKLIGQRENAIKSDLSDILTEELEEKVKEAAETSMGSEITEFDAEHMQCLCVEIIELHNYRSQLCNYLQSRMMVLAPNLTVLVGDLVGARLISKAGSLTNLAKHPASTLQILGAEKALFRAMKSKKNTPKYGLIYHSQLVGQSSIKNKGKMSRMLAAKASLATRVDALGETTGSNAATLGIQHRAKLVSRLNQLEAGNIRRISGTARAKAKFDKYHSKNEYKQYSASVDSTLRTENKPLIEEIVKTETEETSKKKKKKKHSPEQTEDKEEVKVKIEADLPKKKKRRSESNIEQGECSGIQMEPEWTGVTPKKKKKHNKEPKTEDTSEASSIQEVKVESEQSNVSDVSNASKKRKKHSMEQQDTEELDTSLKKKKKRSTERKTKDMEESSSTQATEAETVSDLVPKKKKKKMKDSIQIEEAAFVKTEETFEAGPSEEQKKKKKKKKKEKETEEIQQTTVSVVEEKKVEEPVLSEKKKKKKKEKQD